MNFEPIGFIKSPFKDKFGVPRQASLIQEAFGEVVLQAGPDFVTAVQGLEGFSHLWIVFVFHEHGGKKWKPSIRPPRLGGNKKVGVLASRSPHRPNPIGISVVEMTAIEVIQNQVVIKIKGLDLIDGTPVLDIKPYLPYADAFPSAKKGWADAEIQKYSVRFSEAAEEWLSQSTLFGLRSMISQVLEIDPRPAYMQRKCPIQSSKSEGRKYGIEIWGHEVKYEIADGGLLVASVAPSSAKL